MKLVSAELWNKNKRKYANLSKGKYCENWSMNSQTLFEIEEWKKKYIVFSKCTNMYMFGGMKCGVKT